MGWRLRAKKKKIHKQIEQSIKELTGVFPENLTKRIGQINQVSYFEFLSKMKEYKKEYQCKWLGDE